jgi:cytochrome c oxidase subunit 2
MWFWTFEYQGGKQSHYLVVPLNKAVKINLYSDNVLHSLFIPAFRIKEDVVPGKDNFLWFIPSRLGEYEIFCTAYCGLRHSYMESKVKVIPPAEYETWLANLPVTSAEPEGLTILMKNACTGCHSLDGSKIVSVSFKGMFGKQETVITDGKERTVKIDADYLKTSIFEPDKDITKGFTKGIMKSYKGIVSDDDVKKITDYLQTLK